VVEVDVPPNVKPKAGVLDVIAVVVVDAEEESVDDAESEVVGKVESVGIGRVPMVLTASILFTEEEVVGVPDADVAAPQSVADTVVVDTTVTVTMLSVPMATVGVTIPFVAEEDVVEVPALEGLETDVGLRVGSDDVVTVVEVDEEVKI